MGRTCPHSRTDPPAREEVSTFIAPQRGFFFFFLGGERGAP